MTPTPIDDSQRVVPVDLLPCPFCGGQAMLTRIQDGHQVKCRPCLASGPPVFHGPEGWDACNAAARAAWNRSSAAPAASPPVAPLAAAQDGVKPIPACWRYVHADPSNSSGWMDYDGDAELWELRGKKAQANGLTIELAYSRPPATPEDRRDAERYRWLRRKVSAHGVIDGWAFGFPTHLSLPAPIEAMRDPSGALDAAIDAARDDHEGV